MKEKIIVKIIFFILFFLIYFSQSAVIAKTSSDLDNLIAENAGSYYMSWLIVREFKESKCGYAINLKLDDINNLINDVESQIYNQISYKDKKEFNKVKKTSPSYSKKIVEETINDLFSKNKNPEEYNCFYICGHAMGTLITNIQNWKRILEYRDKVNQ